MKLIVKKWQDFLSESKAVKIRKVDDLTYLLSSPENIDNKSLNIHFAGLGKSQNPQSVAYTLSKNHSAWVETHGPLLVTTWENKSLSGPRKYINENSPNFIRVIGFSKGGLSAYAMAESLGAHELILLDPSVSVQTANSDSLPNVRKIVLLYGAPAMASIFNSTASSDPRRHNRWDKLAARILKLGKGTPEKLSIKNHMKYFSYYYNSI
jgi:hypothetical protein